MRRRLLLALVAMVILAMPPLLPALCARSAGSEEQNHERTVHIT
jgi:hypothetical protein